MHDRIPKDMFYDQGTVGLTLEDVPEDDFFREEPEHDPAEHWFTRLPRNPWAFAGVVFGFGFFTVFINQAPLLYQLVFGAPIFEEMVKFGLALIITLALMWVFGGGRLRAPSARAWNWLGVPLALAVGAGFGWLEHTLTYADVDTTATYIGRLVFHSASAGLCMALYFCADATDPRLRWLAMVPAMFLHYLNNAGALVFGIAGFFANVPIGLAWAGAIVTALVVLFLWTLIAPGPILAGLRSLARRLPRSTRPVAAPTSADRSPATRR